jgi:hypothetical protein
MTDLEMIKKCAEKMGVDAVELNGRLAIPYEHITDVQTYYDPIHDDAQAMALVKKFVILIGVHSGYWTAFIPSVGRSIHNKDLNRAIVECVAKMEQSK